MSTFQKDGITGTADLADSSNPPPALENCRTLAEYIHHAASASNQVPVLGLPRHDQSYSEFESFSAKQLDDLANTFAVCYVELGLKRLDAKESGVVGLLGPANLDYMASFLALAKLGYTIVVISPRLAVSSLVALLAIADCGAVICKHNMYVKAEEMWEEQGIKSIPLLNRATLHSGKPPLAYTPPPSDYFSESSKPGFILHSSGSTGLPKLFPMTHSVILERIKTYLVSPYSNKSLFIISSFYNSAGLTFMLGSLSRSKVTYFCNDYLPYTAEGLGQLVKEARPQCIVAVPFALGRLATTSEGIEAMKTSDNVSVFGAVCPTWLGNELVDHGINLRTGYAM